MTTDKIRVQVVYALPDRQEVVTIEGSSGITAQNAIELSGLLVKHPEIDLQKNKLGIFAKLSKPDTVLRDKDRVEIYRPLIADPKAVRKQRAEEGKAMKKGASDSGAET